MIHFLMDSSLGLLLIFFGIRFSQHLARVKNWESFNFGEYGMNLISCIHCENAFALLDVLYIF